MTDEQLSTLRAAQRYVEEIGVTVQTYDGEGNRLWHDYALTDAFIAGADHVQTFLFLKDKAVADYLWVKTCLDLAIHDRQHAHRVTMETFKKMQAEIEELKKRQR